MAIFLKNIFERPGKRPGDARLRQGEPTVPLKPLPFYEGQVERPDDANRMRVVEKVIVYGFFKNPYITFL
jgi:hypothetical protein